MDVNTFNCQVNASPKSYWNNIGFDMVSVLRTVTLKFSPSFHHISKLNGLHNIITHAKFQLLIANTNNFIKLRKILRMLWLTAPLLLCLET